MPNFLSNGIRSGVVIAVTEKEMRTAAMIVCISELFMNYIISWSVLMIKSDASTAIKTLVADIMREISGNFS